MTLTIDLPPQWERAAQELAAAQGKTVEELARQWLGRSLQEALEDLEDERIAAERLKDIDSGKVQPLSHEEFWGEMDALPD